MRKTSLTRALFVAGAVALAGAAQADAIFYPDGTVVELGDSDTSVAMDDSGIDTTVLGAGPSSQVTTTTTTVPVQSHVYVQPNINWDRSSVMAQMHQRKAMINNKPTEMERQAAGTFNTPVRAGEFSTMTGGVPNRLTHNDHLVVGSTVVPYSSISVTEPYYVMSW